MAEKAWPFPAIPKDKDVIRPGKPSKRRSSSRVSPRMHVERDGRISGRGVVTLAGGAVLGMVLLTGYSNRDLVVQKCVENRLTWCSANSVLLSPPDPVDTTAQFPNINDKSAKVAGMAKYIINPRGAVPVTDKKGVKAIGVGVSVQYNLDKFQQVFGSKDAKGKPIDATTVSSISIAKYVSFLTNNKELQPNCVQDLRNVVDMAKKHASTLQNGIANPDANSVRTAENPFNLKPYTNVANNPNVPDIQPYYDQSTQDPKSKKITIQHLPIGCTNSP